MEQFIENEISISVTEQERIALQTVSLEYLKSIARFEEINGSDAATTMIKSTLQSTIKKLESAKLNADVKQEV